MLRMGGASAEIRCGWEKKLAVGRNKMEVAGHENKIHFDLGVSYNSLDLGVRVDIWHKQTFSSQILMRTARCAMFVVCNCMERNPRASAKHVDNYGNILMY
jgi:competence transcription factor ComK